MNPTPIINATYNYNLYTIILTLNLITPLPHWKILLPALRSVPYPQSS